MFKGVTGFSMLLVVGLLVGIALFLGWGILIGWVLTQLFSFSHFEGTLLAMLATGFMIHVMMTIILTMVQTSLGTSEDMMDEDMEIEYAIPAERFFKDISERTWAAWIRFQLANNIYEKLQETPKMTSLNSSQLQELAVRLADMGVAILREQSPRSSRIHLSISDFHKQMKAMDMKPYDNDILHVAVDAANFMMMMPLMQNIFRENLWDSPAIIME
jgi:hypothetical protein